MFQPGDRSRQPRALLSHSMVLYGFQPRGFRLPGPKSVPSDFAGPKVVVIQEPLAALSASHGRSSWNMLSGPLDCLATIPLRLGSSRTCKGRRCTSCTNGSNSGDSKKLFHLS